MVKNDHNHAHNIKWFIQENDPTEYKPGWAPTSMWFTSLDVFFFYI